MHIYNLILSTLCFLCLSESRKLHDPLPYEAQNGVVAMTIVVDQSGKGNFTKIQDAINIVPYRSNVWTKIQINAGKYNERIMIPPDKQNIFMVGVSQNDTVIQWEAGGPPGDSVGFVIQAENFKAQYITFKNTYNVLSLRDVNGRPRRQAPALLANADKAFFYKCSFISLQDTLWDNGGRHYFLSCYIEGAVDFIWGNGQSLYEDCTINFNGAALNGIPGYITAQGKDRLAEHTGYTFTGGRLTGTGKAYLGRAYRQYASVLIHKMYLPSIVVPEGWDAWNYAGSTESISFVEDECTGPGADMSKRVKWQKKYSIEKIKLLTNVNEVVNRDHWLEKQPN